MKCYQQLTQVGLSNKYLVNIAISVRRILLGFFIAIAIGVPLGLADRQISAVRDFFMPVVEMLRPIPAIAWVPMSIMLWPNNEASIVFITFIGAFFPILLNTIHGVHSLDRRVGTGRTLPRRQRGPVVPEVILPGSLPHIFTGLAVGMGVAWVSLIAAEMISGQFGVGYFTWEAYSLVNYPAIVLGMITIGVLGLACSDIIRMVGVLMMPWLHSHREQAMTMAMTEPKSTRASSMFAISASRSVPTTTRLSPSRMFRSTCSPASSSR